MDLEGSVYLYTLAQLSMAFVAFSTISIVVRVGMGAMLSRSHVLLVRLYIELGFMAITFSMLPMLLAGFGLAHATVWRVSQICGCAVGAWWMLIYPRRHHAATAKPMPRFVYVEYFIGWSALVYGLANAAGYPTAPSFGPYAVLATWVFVLAAAMFLLTMNAFLRPRETSDQKDAGSKQNP